MIPTMLLVILAAILGAALGLFVRPRVIAIAAALAVAGGLHEAIALAGRIVEKEPGRHALAQQIDILVGLDNDSLWPVLAAAGAGSIGAAVMWSLARRETTDRFWFPGDETSDRRKGDRRKRLRAMNQVEERAIHQRAESRFHDLLDQ